MLDASNCVAHLDGVADDWPVDYDEMEPYYAAAERIIGVAGDDTGNPFAAWRSGPYPMPPGADMYCAIVTAESISAAPSVEREPFNPPRTDVGIAPFDDAPEFRYNMIPDALLLNTNLMHLDLVSDGRDVRVAMTPALEDVTVDSGFKLVDRAIGMRVPAEVEWSGLDSLEMGSDAYPRG